MKTQLLKSVMVANKDTQEKLAQHLNRALSTINAKINGTVDWTLQEVQAIQKRYGISDNEIIEIFFKD